MGQSVHGDQFGVSSMPASSTAAADVIAANAASVEEWRIPQVQQGDSDHDWHPHLSGTSELFKSVDSQHTQSLDSLDVQPSEEQKPHAEALPTSSANDDYDIDMADVLTEEELNEPFIKGSYTGFHTKSQKFGEEASTIHAALGSDTQGSQTHVDVSPTATEQAQFTFGSDADSLMPGAEMPMDAYLRR